MNREPSTNAEAIKSAPTVGEPVGKAEEDRPVRYEPPDIEVVDAGEVAMGEYR